MEKNYESKKYEPYKILEQRRLLENEPVQASRQMKTNRSVFPDMQAFVELEIDGVDGSYKSETVSGAGRVKSENHDFARFAHATGAQAIEPVEDEKYNTYITMRQIAWDGQYQRIDQSKILYKQAHRIELSRIFYKQAIFMKDFEDDYTEQTPFSTYYPNYLLLRYEQFRTYFTWRTRVRNGDIANIPVSYAFIYMYELLNNIGVHDPQEGLERLMTVWKTLRVFYAFMDKYVYKWIRDYHIYYELPKPFKDFICDNNLFTQYPDMYTADHDDSFALYCSISKYDIKSSTFYNEDTSKIIQDCFLYVIDRLKQLCNAAGIGFDDLIYHKMNKKLIWTPFDGALFYQKTNQPDRQVVLSEKEIYVCRENTWSRRSASESNGQFVAYIMKKMESVLRKAMHFKYKLTAPPHMIDSATTKQLSVKGIILEKAIEDAVTEFYTEINKKVIIVDKTVLERVRREALDIQEKLLIQEDMHVHESAPYQVVMNEHECDPYQTDREAHRYTPVQAVGEPTTSPMPDIWASFQQSLTKTELEALSMILHEEDIQHFSVHKGMMAEVLIDGINQKAYDTINDTVLDFGDTVTVYPEYSDKLMKMVM